jgi:fructuronate reductase
MTRLTASAVLPASVRLPAYARESLRVGIVHLGIGAFHRAHQAVFTEDAIEQGGGDWGILGVSLRSAGVRDQLVPQNGLYTLVERGPEGERLRQIGCVRGVLVAPESPAAVIEAIAAASTQIVSLTVTEKGYCHDPATGTLNDHHPDIVWDWANPSQPRSAIGFIVAGLAARRTAGSGGLSLLCCDNLPHNGALLARVVDTFARQRDPVLADWIAAHVTCPSTMVDRIVPATTADDIAALEQHLGVRDEAMVKAEPFRQWVIEDRFAGERPAWDRVGVQFVADVAPFELAKLRLLNGSHSTIAYLGQLAGYDFVHEAVADPHFAQLVRHLMAVEVAPTLPATPGMDLAHYQNELFERFANPALQHRTRQIAMDGSQKLPQRLLGTIIDRLAANQSIDALALAVAAWMRYCLGRTEAGEAYRVDDPLSPQFAEIAGKAGDDASAILEGFLQLTSVFGPELPQDSRFRSAVLAALRALLHHGAAETVATMSRRLGEAA